MKMAEFLLLTEDEKVNFMDEAAENGADLFNATEDEGACSQCGGVATTGDYCFGCQQLVCLDCMQEDPHYSQCRLGGE